MSTVAGAQCMRNIIPKLSLCASLIGCLNAEAGKSQWSMVERFGCNHNTLSALLRWHRQRNDVRDLPDSWCPRVMTVRQHQWKVVTHLLNRRKNAAQTFCSIPDTRGIHKNISRNWLLHTFYWPCDFQIWSINFDPTNQTERKVLKWYGSSAIVAITFVFPKSLVWTFLSSK